MRIEPVQIPRADLTEALQRQQSAQPAAPAAPASGPSFGRQVSDAVGQVNDLQTTANRLVEQVASGEVEDTHKAVVAMEHALLALDFTLQVRNKMLDAYQEIMRTQL